MQRRQCLSVLRHAITTPEHVAFHLLWSMPRSHCLHSCPCCWPLPKARKEPLLRNSRGWKCPRLHRSIRRMDLGLAVEPETLEVCTSCRCSSSFVLVVQPTGLMALMRSPIHLAQGTAQELPSALYLLPSGHSSAGFPRHGMRV